MRAREIRCKRQGWRYRGIPDLTGCPICLSAHHNSSWRGLLGQPTVGVPHGSCLGQQVSGYRGLKTRRRITRVKNQKLLISDPCCHSCLLRTETTTKDMEEPGARVLVKGKPYAMAPGALQPVTCLLWRPPAYVATHDCAPRASCLEAGPASINRV